MAYTLKKLKTAQEVQRLVKQYGKLGSGPESGHSNEWIYKHIIYPNYWCSRPTFYDYLSIDVRYEMKQTQASPLPPPREGE